MTLISPEIKYPISTLIPNRKEKTLLVTKLDNIAPLVSSALEAVAEELTSMMLSTMVLLEIILDSASIVLFSLLMRANRASPSLKGHFLFDHAFLFV